MCVQKKITINNKNLQNHNTNCIQIMLHFSQLAFTFYNSAQFKKILNIVQHFSFTYLVKVNFFRRGSKKKNNKWT